MFHTSYRFVIAVILAASVLGVPQARGTYILSSDGLTVYDTVHDVTWLADFDLPASNRFGVPQCDSSHAVPCINPSGSMDWDSATSWLNAMNASHYLGEANWRIPTTPPTDPGCGKKGPNGNSFGFGCSASALGSIYYIALGFQAPNTVVPIPPNQAEGPFINFQPYLYWSQSSRGGEGFATFSFNTGFHGANTAPNFLYVLPTFEGRLSTLTWPAPNGNHLILDTSGRAVYDPQTDRTFPADANLPATRAFGMDPCTDPTTPSLCINSDGSMTADSAARYIIKMNNQTYLGTNQWELPTIDIGCGMYECSGSDNPMGNLYYSQFQLTRGTPVVNAPNITVGPFHNIQPYLYWACTGDAFEAECRPRGPANNFEWSFSYGSGFEGTDLVGNTLYVTAYFTGQRSQ